MVITRQNFLVHFVFDFMTFLEQKDVIKGQLYHEHYFETILELLRSKAVEERPDLSDVQSRIVQAMYFFHIENEWLSDIVKTMIAYYKQHKDDKNQFQTKIVDKKKDKEHWRELKGIQNYRVKGLKHLGDLQPDKGPFNGFGQVEALEYKLLHARDAISFEHFGEATMFLYVYFFKDYTTMTEERLDLGVTLLRQAFQLQTQLNK